MYLRIIEDRCKRNGLAQSTIKVAVSAALAACLIGLVIGYIPSTISWYGPNNTLQTAIFWPGKGIVVENSTTTSPPPAPSEGPVEAEFIAIDTDEFDLQLSSFKCQGKDPVFQVCIFNNLLLHQGWLIYIVEDKDAAVNLELPDPNLYDIGNSDINGFTIKEHFLVSTMAEVEARLATAASSSHRLRVASYERAIFHRTRTYYHWYWSLTGASNVIIRLCKYFGACTPEAVRSSLILSPLNVGSLLSLRSAVGVPSMQAIRDLMQCFGPVYGVNHVAIQGTSAPDDRIVFIQKLLTGIGEHVSQPHASKGPKQEIRYKGPTVPLGLARTRVLRQCAGLSPDPPPMRGVSVLLVNRPHNDGRHIIGLDDVYDKLVRALPEDVTIKQYYPRAESMASQAAAFASSNIIVVPHGSANANLVFIPHDAVVFAFFAVQSRHDLDVDHVQALPMPPYNVTLVPIDCTGSIQANIQSVAGIPSFAKLDAKSRAFLLGDPTMSTTKANALRKALKLTLKEWMKFVDYVPNPTELAAKVANASIELRARLVKEHGG